jgi:hypothetical protein
MTRTRHEIPTHLAVEDRLVLGLSARRAMYLVAATAGGYSAWTEAAAAPPELRLGLAVLCLLAGAALALVRPGRRGLDEWLFVVLHHLATPKRCAWRPREPDPAGWRPRAPAFAARTPRVAWTEERS